MSGDDTSFSVIVLNARPSSIPGTDEQVLSKIIFSEKILSVHMSASPVPSHPPKKVTEIENFAKQSCQIYFKGDKKIFSHAAVLGEAKLSYVYSILKPHF